MLGGNNKERFENLQKNINEIIQINAQQGADLNEKDFDVKNTEKKKKINHYQQLFLNVIYNDVCFNLAPEYKKVPQHLSEPSIELIVDKMMGNGERPIVVVQRVARFGEYGDIVGVITLSSKRTNQSFMIDRSIMENKKSTVKHFFYQFAKRETLNKKKDVRGRFKDTLIVRRTTASNYVNYGVFEEFDSGCTRENNQKKGPINRKFLNSSCCRKINAN
jgi:hypothetical protein